MTLQSRLSVAIASLKARRPVDIFRLISDLRVTAGDIATFLEPPNGNPYGRRLILSEGGIEVLLMNWASKHECAPHDHGASFGFIRILNGTARERRFTLRAGKLELLTDVERTSARPIFVKAPTIHSMINPHDAPLITLHAYAPAIHGMKVYDPLRCVGCVVRDTCGAWLPTPEERLAEFSLGFASEQTSSAG